MSFSAGRNLQNNINTTEAQTLSNKTLDGSTVIQDGATIQTPDIIDPDRLDVKKDTLSNLQTYASTASNGQLVYATDSKKMFQVLDSALAEVGGGAGGINYITNPDAEVNADGWSNYANTVAGELPDDFGGTVSGSWDNIAASSASPLRGSKSFIFGGINSGSGDLQGHGVYSSFTVDSADLAKKMTISFDYKLDDSALTNAVDGMLKVFIYDEDKSQLIRVNGEDIQLNANSGTHYAQFQTDATSTNYRLVIHNALALNIGEDFNIRLDNVQVGPREVVKGAAMTDWEDFDMVIDATTTAPVKGTATENAKWRRVGDSMEIMYTYYQTVAGSAGTGTYIFKIPTGYSIDTDKILNLAGTGLDGVGQAQVWNTGLTNLTGGVRVQSNGFILDVNNATSEANVGSSFASLASANIRYSFTAKVPIQGWSSNAKMSEDLGGREVVCRAKSSAGTTILTNNTVVDIVYENVDYDTSSSYNNSTGEFTAPETGYYDVSASVRAAILLSDNNVALIRILKNGTPFASKRVEGETSTTMDQSYHISTTVQLDKGDTLSIAFFQNGGGNPNQGTDQLENYFHIAKRSSPQTILETETVAARYTSNSGQVMGTTATDLIFEDLDFDTHNSMNTSTGEYTIPTSGYYNINSSIMFDNAGVTWTSGEISDLNLFVNGSLKTSLDYYEQTSTQSNMYVKLKGSDTLYLNKGDVIKFNSRKTIASQNLLASSAYNYVSISRVK